MMNGVGTMVAYNNTVVVQGSRIGVVGRNWLVEGNALSHGLGANTFDPIRISG